MLEDYIRQYEEAVSSGNKAAMKRIEREPGNGQGNASGSGKGEKKGGESVDMARGDGRMNEVARMMPERIENLAIEIREFLLEYGMWIDVAIYFNDKCFTTCDRETGKFYYNDREHLIVKENEDPKIYFEHVNPDHIFSMSFEGLNVIQPF